MEKRSKKLTLAKEKSIVKANTALEAHFINGELHLTSEKMSLAEEIKILIRKLWN